MWLAIIRHLDTWQTSPIFTFLREITRLLTTLILCVHCWLHVSESFNCLKEKIIICCISDKPSPRPQRASGLKTTEDTEIIFLSFIFSVFILTFQSVAEKITGAKLMHSAALLEAKEHGEASLCLKNGERWELAPTWYCTSSPEEEALRLLMPEVGSFSIRWRKKKGLSSCICSATPRTREAFSLSTAFRGRRERGRNRQGGRGKGNEAASLVLETFHHCLVWLSCYWARVLATFERKSSRWAAGSPRYAWNSRQSLKTTAWMLKWSTSQRLSCAKRVRYAGQVVSSTLFPPNDHRRRSPEENYGFNNDTNRSFSIRKFHFSSLRCSIRGFRIFLPWDVS